MGTPKFAGSSEKISDGRRRSLANLKAHEYKPGQSGNPSGRSPKSAFDSALETLLEETIGSKAVARIAAESLLNCIRKGDVGAIKLMAERTGGRPVQPVDVEGRVTHKLVIDL